jgi:beta-lactamase regulating signal transducer with metallopeptidase domain
MELLLNWLWQGCVLAAVASCAMSAAGPRLNAATRCALWWGVVALILLAPGVALWARVPAGVSGAAGPTHASRTVLVTLAPPSQAVTTLGLGLWAAWSGASIWGLVVALRHLRRVRRACRAFPVDREARLRRWMAVRDTGRPVTLALCDDVRTAAAVGLGAPVIALAPAIVAQLSDEEVEQVVLHEYAHIRRRDDWGSLALALVRAVAGPHPAVWWAARQLRLERELACDASVVAQGGRPTSYARCLTRLAATRPATGSLLVPGALQRSHLAVRVKHLLTRRPGGSPPRRLAIAATILFLLALTTVALSPLEPVAIAAAFPTVAASPRGLGPDALATTEPRERSGEGAPLSPAGHRDDAAYSSDRRLAMARASAVRLREMTGAPARARKVGPKPVTRLRATAPSAAAGLPRATDAPADAAAHLEATAPALASAPPGASLIVSRDTPPTFEQVPRLGEGTRLRHGAGAGEASAGIRAPAAWTTATDGARAVGRGSQRAAVRTAAFFSRVSRSLAGAF